MLHMMHGAGRVQYSSPVRKQLYKAPRNGRLQASCRYRVDLPGGFCSSARGAAQLQGAVSRRHNPVSRRLVDFIVLDLTCRFEMPHRCFNTAELSCSASPTHMLTSTPWSRQH